MKNYTTTGFALMYPNGSLAAIDNSSTYGSGGYPYEAKHFHEVWITTEKEAQRYLATGNAEGFVIVPVSLKIERL